MFLDTLLSCCLLFLASGSCIYLSGKWSLDFFKISPDIIAVTLGVLAINLRSTFNLIFPFYFHTTYSIDPLEIEEEDEYNIELRTAPLFEKICRVTSNFGLIFAVCEVNNNRKIGIFITSIVIFTEVYHAIFMDYRKQPKERFFNFLWMFVGTTFGWIKGNRYCMLAYLPYWTAFLEFPPEKGYIWSVPRIINNYMMIAHIFLMFEAIRATRAIN